MHGLDTTDADCVLFRGALSPHWLSAYRIEMEPAMIESSLRLAGECSYRPWAIPAGRGLDLQHKGQSAVEQCNHPEGPKCDGCVVGHPWLNAAPNREHRSANRAKSLALNHPFRDISRVSRSARSRRFHRTHPNLS